MLMAEEDQEKTSFITTTIRKKGGPARPFGLKKAGATTTLKKGQGGYDFDLS